MIEERVMRVENAALARAGLGFTQLLLGLKLVGRLGMVEPADNELMGCMRRMPEC